MNCRKEFFRITLEEIEEEVKKIFPDAEFIRTAEARQYKESKMIREERERKMANVKILDELPDAI